MHTKTLFMSTQNNMLSLLSSFIHPVRDMFSIFAEYATSIQRVCYGAVLLNATLKMSNFMTVLNGLLMS